MPDEPRPITAPRDASRIDLNAAEEVRYWAQALGASEEVLREAVGHAGVEVEKVREFLGSGS